jgi:pyruvate/2-oxoglutarate dehydrogenase complex dihydrolipoamide acyltransferase (E2) component
LFTCAAALFLVVGWIGGGTLAGHDTETPAVASGAVVNQDQHGTPRVPSEPAPASEAPKPPSAPTVAQQSDDKPPVTPSSKKVKQKAAEPTTANSTANTSGQSRSNQVDQTTAAAQSPTDAMSAQFQQLISAWANSQGYRGYGETPRGFGR